MLPLTSSGPSKSAFSRNTAPDARKLVQIQGASADLRAVGAACRPHVDLRMRLMRNCASDMARSPRNSRILLTGGATDTSNNREFKMSRTRASSSDIGVKQRPQSIHMPEIRKAHGHTKTQPTPTMWSATSCAQCGLGHRGATTKASPKPTDRQSKGNKAK